MPIHPLPDFKAFLTEGKEIDPTGYHEYKQQPIRDLCGFLKDGGYHQHKVKQGSQFKALLYLLWAGQDADRANIAFQCDYLQPTKRARLLKAGGKFEVQFTGDVDISRMENATEIPYGPPGEREVDAEQKAIDLF